MLTYVYLSKNNPASNYMFKVNNRNTRTKREIYSKLIIKTPERWQWRCSGVFIVNFEHISHLVLVCASIVNFEQVKAKWDEMLVFGKFLAMD